MIYKLFDSQNSPRFLLKYLIIKLVLHLKLHGLMQNRVLKCDTNYFPPVLFTRHARSLRKTSTMHARVLRYIYIHIYSKLLSYYPHSLELTIPSGSQTENKIQRRIQIYVNLEMAFHFKFIHKYQFPVANLNRTSIIKIIIIILTLVPK
jgi:hypothetical protein